MRIECAQAARVIVAIYYLQNPYNLDLLVYKKFKEREKESENAYNQARCQRLHGTVFGAVPCESVLRGHYRNRRCRHDNLWSVRHTGARLT